MGAREGEAHVLAVALAGRALALCGARWRQGCGKQGCCAGVVLLPFQLSTVCRSGLRVRRAWRWRGSFAATHRWLSFPFCESLLARGRKTQSGGPAAAGCARACRCVFADGNMSNSRSLWPRNVGSIESSTPPTVPIISEFAAAPAPRMARPAALTKNVPKLRVAPTCQHCAGRKASRSRRSTEPPPGRAWATGCALTGIFAAHSTANLVALVRAAA